MLHLLTTLDMIGWRSLPAGFLSSLTCLGSVIVPNCPHSHQEAWHKCTWLQSGLEYEMVLE